MSEPDFTCRVEAAVEGRLAVDDLLAGLQREQEAIDRGDDVGDRLPINVGATQVGPKHGHQAEVDEVSVRV